MIPLSMLFSLSSHAMTKKKKLLQEAASMNNNTGVEVIMADRRSEQLSFTQYVASGAMCNVCDARGETVTANMASNT